jgi:hypothetical protein
MTADRDLSTEARSANADRLDAAIDRVAKQLTQVEEDSQLAARIAAALPDRFTWFGWLTDSWAPRLAVLAIAVGAFGLWNMGHTTDVTPAAQPLAISAHRDWAPLVVSAMEREPLAPSRTAPLEPMAPVVLVEPFPDLPPVKAPASVEIALLAPSSLPAEQALSIEPLVIADLPLTTESFPQRD